MKLTIGTQRLQALLNKAVKGAGNNKLIPMTSLIAIRLKDGALTLTTTDATNYLTLIEKGVAGDEFYVAVQVDLLARLVSKMTCDEVTFEVTDNSLNVIGNGKYQIGIELEDDGTPVKLPNPTESFNKGDNEIGKVDSSVITNVLSSVKPALATTMEYPWYTCYYIKDRVVATDTYTVADYSNGFLKDAKLIDSNVMDLLGLFSGEILVFADGDKMLFECENGVVYATIPNGIENYSIDDIEALVQQKFNDSCTVVKSSLLSLLDRISLFVGAYDNGKITLSFSNNELEITSKYANEKIAYTKADSSGEFVCQTDVNTLATQIKAQVGSEITIEYGEDNAIKIVDGDITSVIALLDE